MRYKETIISVMMFLTAVAVQAQITIGGSVYGGGNAGDTGGKTTVNVYAGDIHAVFAGARMANIGGSAFVHIDGEHASNYILADYVYGGNDIAGTIGTSANLPTELTQVGTEAGKNNIDNTWNAFVRISTKMSTSDPTMPDETQKTYIGQLFGGGNGYYKYENKTTEAGTIVKDKVTDETIVSSTSTLSSPQLAKTYLEILGGSIVYAYGGGNDATVTDKTIICLDNPSKVVGSIIDDTNPNANTDSEKGTVGELLNDARFEKMRINTTFTYPNSEAFQIGRLFGGNNKADMAIRPRWNLKRGKVRNLYGGGNEGRMTSPEGLLLQVDGEGMVVDNVYGGCRKADVRALDSNGTPIPYENIQLDPSDNPNNIPGGYAARVRILKGNVNNVYGGNDISGNIYGGSTVGILSRVHGNVYGGGNGSYAYTDNAKLKDDPKYSDFYYDVNAILKKPANYEFSGLESAEALNIFRPNAERVSILVRGTQDNPTIVEGALYVGGNSASLRSQSSGGSSGSNMTHVKVGSYVTIDKVFLGNNGENMIKTDEADAEGRGEGVLRTLASTKEDPDGNDAKFSRMDLTDTEQFKKYMEGCAMKVNPTVVFESKDNGDKENYIAYSTKFGSIFCGGNVGSIIVPGKITVDFNDKIIVYDKVVGGSNMANVYQSAFNAQYLGGLLGNPAPVPEGSPEGTIGDKLVLNFGGLKIQPMRWKMNGNDYVLDDNGDRILEWNTVDSRTFDPVTKKYSPMDPVAKDGSTTYDPDNDPYRRFQGGNIYGGCYSNGHVNGNVVINLNASLVDRKGENSIFDQVEENEGEAKLYDDNPNITRRFTGVLLGEQGMDPLGRALNVFGGGYGGDSEIWGSTTINLNAGYTFQIFGGGEQGAIGNAVSHTPGTNALTYTYDERYSTYINLKGSKAGVYRGYKNANDSTMNDTDDMAEAEFIYGGSFEGLIAGSTHINLGNGRIFNSFAGSCNADILGHTETYVGRNSNDDNDLGFPWIRDHIYGGNDLGGRIFANGGTDGNDCNFKDRVNPDYLSKVYGYSTNNTNPKVLKASAYTEYIQGRVEYIFGGCYGDYDYTNDHYKAYAYTTGSTDKTDENLGTMRSGYYKPWMDNAFVNFRPNNAARNSVARIYGAGQGHAYAHQSDADRDAMQDRSYVLIDAPENTKYVNTEVFGAGDYSGVGMRNTSNIQYVPDLTPAIARDNADGVTASTVIDLMRGHLKDVYGASYKEGITRRTIVNVPTGSTIHLNRIFGGAYGLDNAQPCDVFESNINYNSADAIMQGYVIPEDQDKDGNLMSGGIYGGNNNARRTLYSRININSLVFNGTINGTAKYSAKVFGAGYGKDTWAQYTEVNLNNGASVYEVYGGGYGGMVLNTQSVNASGFVKDLPTGYTDEGLNSYLVKTNPLGEKTNTNVYINKGAYVAGYCYGAGLGADATVSGTTYIGLHGGTVNKDLYAAGWGGPVYDKYKLAKDTNTENDFVATANAYIEGGTVRNVYGGGYQGAVGYHEGVVINGKINPIAGATTNDILGKTNVVIGIRQDQDINFTNTEIFPDGYGYYKGVPAIQRNAYSGGEGGAVFGEAHLTLNNGYVGYVYLLADEMQDEQGKKVKNPSPAENATARYEAKIHDETYYEKNNWAGANRLQDYGNLFGGGYDDLSSTDESFVEVWGGTVRGCVHGGGEIATIGRGRVIESDQDNSVRVLTKENYYQEGKTHVTMYNGHVLRNVFGGGKGYNINGYGMGSNKLYTDGYVFGQTEVFIHGGEIGTDAGLAEGYGNVFGGGDVGYVYSKGYFSTKTVNEKNANPGGTTGSPNHWYYYDDAGNLTEDCKVVIAPMLQIKKNGSSVTFNGKTYGAYDYVPTDYLNTLPADKTDAKWANLYMGDNQTSDDKTERGVHIHNAVFAGGNVSSNSESYNNAITVFGNTTATLYDVYHHDFITVGTEHTGGLYGGGNLSLVGGYRELNITNYGTDYYGLDQQISLVAYRDSLTNRERAYFKLEYQCQENVTIGDKNYTIGDRISEDDYNALPNTYKSETYWKQYGFCSIYAGRLLNTIQRADFCGVYGSRLVLQGSRDRVAEKGDATEYTLNRIGELSLNQQRSVIPSDLTLKPGVATKPNPDDYDPEDYADPKNAIHGNYFGIYSVVNYLGALTSDVHFDDPRRYVLNGSTYVDKENTYYHWKEEHLQKRDRNNGTALNQVALASGVFLELTTENSTPSNKKYGTITGIIELDLINIKKDIEGGGYVYARNEHGARTYHDDYKNVLLSDYNKKILMGDLELRDSARTYKSYTYDSNLQTLQTSGNFIHKSKRIVDDCYPNNGIYNDGYVKSPAHYWFIKGEVYIYEQTISAYAGSATAYRREVKIPLTITAGSNGKLKLLNIQPSLYAYYADNNGTKIGKDGVKVDNESVTYKLNDVISWWDWHQLADSEKSYFVKETVINVDSCTINGIPYSAGTYVLENDPRKDKTAWDTFQESAPVVKDARGVVVTDLTKMFRSSNNMGHNTGYVLTFDMNSPKDWDDWYSPTAGTSTYTVSNDVVTTNRKNSDQYDPVSDKETYREGPTYTLKAGEPSGLYGQRNYAEGEIISEETYKDYTTTVSKMPSPPTVQTGQAEVEAAYVAKADIGAVQAGTAISNTAYQALTDKTNYSEAMVCINTIQYGDEDYILLGELVAKDELNTIAQKYKQYNNDKINADPIDDDQALKYVTDNLSNAYYIKTAGLYGGQYFETGVNYTAIKSWCELTESRDKFQYNYDALDVLIDPDFHGEGYTATYYKSPYSDVKSVEYQAYNSGSTALTYYDINGSQHSLDAGKSITREAYENVRNDQLHYTRIQIDKKPETGSDKQDVYIVMENIISNGTPYAKGQDINEKDYNSLSSENKAKVHKETFTKGSAAVIKYYCYEDYTPSANFSVEKGTCGKAGSIISEDVFKNSAYVPNYQKLFTILGAEPTETTTLYVSRESNAKDVMSEKVYSVVYQYTYYEPDDESDGVSLVNELHVVNIHVKLESGAPQIGQLTAPAPVLPGNTVGVKAPTVNPGLYEILTSGWELFMNEDDALFQRNGKPFSNNTTPLYWYQNQKVFLAFYSKTYLGKTYSNYVPLTVANYHDLDAVMKDKKHHLYVDHPDVARNSKIYIDNRTCESDPTKSELDLLKDFFDLSLQTEKAATGATADHELLNSRVKGGAKLEFILNSDVSPKAYANNWTPIGNDTQCFNGNFHGDGYTISGLSNSLFGKLCGNVYNLGVTGSFTSAGVADSGDGYVENCWIRTTGTPTADVKAVFNGGTDGSQIDGDRKLLVNCYYPKTNAYKDGLATPMTDTQFYNGTVAYNLNGFYLNKRYYDKQLTSGTEYKYLKSVDGTVNEEMSTGYYPSSYAFYPLDGKNQSGLYGYVEDRYADGDFIYAGGTIPEANDERMRVVTRETTSTVTYAPIWPDDYIYFGQMLTFGYKESRPHQDYPSHIAKSGGRLPATDLSNRVYRAPAYYQSKDMDVAHFNLYAYLVAKSAQKSVTDQDLKDAYPNMTAIDFYGHNDNTWALGFKSEGFAADRPAFYPPLLDDDEGLVKISTEGETPNLLVYAPSAETKTSTCAVLTEHFADPDYTSYYEGGDYRRVGAADAGAIHGHLVQATLTNGKPTATNDHLLVDKRDFNCPISYTFADGKRMWYQRTPDRYVTMEGGTIKGWEDICLPFEVELVTTQTKGELSHFYQGSTIGHEYWLRELTNIQNENPDDLGIFKYPKLGNKNKVYTNTFLYDYYYRNNGFDDANGDDYQKNYYASSHTFDNYPLQQAGKPYLIGFPGSYYYEFDLSGTWKPQNAAPTAPAQLEQQAITFASNPGITIAVSDTEMKKEEYKGYQYCANYKRTTVPSTGYLLNADGSKYAALTAETEVLPFRPYFVLKSTNASRTRGESASGANNILINDELSKLGVMDHQQPNLADNLIVTTGKKKICVESQLSYTTDVRIVSPTGATLTSYSIQPSEYMETQVYNAGVYIVYADDGKYVKKVIVRK